MASQEVTAPLLDDSGAPAGDDRPKQSRLTALKVVECPNGMYIANGKARRRYFRDHKAKIWEHVQALQIRTGCGAVCILLPATGDGDPEVFNHPAFGKLVLDFVNDGPEMLTAYNDALRLADGLKLTGFGDLALSFKTKVAFAAYLVTQLQRYGKWPQYTSILNSDATSKWPDQAPLHNGKPIEWLLPDSVAALNAAGVRYASPRELREGDEYDGKQKVGACCMRLPTQPEVMLTCRCPFNHCRRTFSWTCWLLT
jgi:hypothetical protein